MENLQRKRIIKRILIIIASIVVVGCVAYGTLTALSYFIPKKDSQPAVTLTPQQQAAERAKQDMSTALGSESKGDTAAAIASYKEALKDYAVAGDKASIQAVQLKLQYLESLK